VQKLLKNNSNYRTDFLAADSIGERSFPFIHKAKPCSKPLYSGFSKERGLVLVFVI